MTGEIAGASNVLETAINSTEARSRRAYDAARLGYQRGLNDLDTVLNAAQAWRNTRIQLTSAEVQSLRQAVAAYKAIGGGWPAASYPAQGH